MCRKMCRPRRFCSNGWCSNRWTRGLFPYPKKNAMNDDFLPGGSEAGTSRELDTLGSSTIYKLCEEVIALREYDKRQLRSLEQTLNKVRDELKTSFNSFAADTQRAYQQLRQETHGEKRVSLALLNEII